jgi:hypothetical protein
VKANICAFCQLCLAFSLPYFWAKYFKTFGHNLQQHCKKGGVVIHQQPSHRQPISSTVSTHRQGYKWTFHRHPTHLQGQLIDRAMLGANSSTACMKLGFQEPPLVAPVLSLLDPSVWLDGARPANTCIPPSFP